MAPPISPYTGHGWSPPICRLPLELRSVFHIFLRDVPHVFMAIILSVSLTRHSHRVMFLGHLQDK